MRWLALLCLVGCGLGPAPASFTPTAGDGIAPWSDLGPAQVCLGDQALGPPASAPGGLCVSVNAAAEPCLADGDCRSREACVCGRCTIAYCASATDCAAPRVCTFSQHRCDLACSSSTQCGDVEECIAGVCRGRCAVDADCQHGEVCDSNHVCVVASCADTGSCLTGERCEVQRTPRQVLEPGPLANAGAPFVVYLELAQPNLPDLRSIWRATSSDGIHFKLDPSQPVLDDARAPFATFEAGKISLYFEHGDGTALGVATSTDGITFAGRADFFTPTTGKVRAPAMVAAAGKVVVYFQLGDGDGIAMLTGGTDHVFGPPTTVLRPVDVQVGDGTPGTAFWMGITKLGSPHAVLAGESIHLFFSAFGTESAPAIKNGSSQAIPPNYSVGFAAADPRTPGQLSVWRYGPVADRVEAFFDHRDELGPGVVDAGDDRFLMYYIDASGAALGSLGVLGSGQRGK